MSLLFLTFPCTFHFSFYQVSFNVLSLYLITFWCVLSLLSSFPPPFLFPKTSNHAKPFPGGHPHLSAFRTIFPRVLINPFPTHVFHPTRSHHSPTQAQSTAQFKYCYPFSPPPFHFPATHEALLRPAIRSPRPSILIKRIPACVISWVFRLDDRLRGTPLVRAAVWSRYLLPPTL